MEDVLRRCFQQPSKETAMARTGRLPTGMAGFVAAVVFCGIAAAQPPTAGAAAPPRKEAEPPPHPAVGQRFSPDNVDWQHPLYQTTFDNPAVLKDWRLEGGKRMSIADGKLVLESEPGSNGSQTIANHLVCWLVKEMPADFLLEFSVRPQNRQQGLNIVFFNARGLHGENIFEPPIRPRNGLFKQYHSGDLNNYHISYWAGDRGTANVRKNQRFHLVAVGRDLVAPRPGRRLSDRPRLQARRNDSPDGRRRHLRGLRRRRQDVGSGLDPLGLDRPAADGPHRRAASTVM